MTISKPIRLAFMAGMMFGAVNGELHGGGQAPADPSTLVASNQYAKWNKDHVQATFDTLGSFDYPIPPPGKKLSDRKVTPPSAVQKLDKQRVAIKGYMLPVDMDAQGVTQFILVADLQTCCFGVHGDPNTWILVTMAKKTSLTLMSPVTVYGTFHIGEIIQRGQTIDLLESFYRMDGAALAIHTEAFDKSIGEPN